jgi:hypothetical protein
VEEKALRKQIMAKRMPECRDDRLTTVCLQGIKSIWCHVRAQACKPGQNQSGGGSLRARPLRGCASQQVSHINWAPAVPEIFPHTKETGDCKLIAIFPRVFTAGRKGFFWFMSF